MSDKFKHNQQQAEPAVALGAGAVGLAVGLAVASAAEPTQRTYRVQHPLRIWLGGLLTTLIVSSLAAAVLVWWALIPPGPAPSLQQMAGSDLAVGDPASTADWNLIVWDKALWPRQRAAAVQQGPPPKPPAVELIAIVQRGNEMRAAVDFGDGMRYMHEGDEFAGLQIIKIHQEKVDVAFNDQHFSLDLP